MKLVSSNAPLNVLFLCTGDSARSIREECMLNRLGAGQFCSSSAGSQPRGPSIPMLSQAELRNASQLRSKSWDEFAPRRAEARFRLHRLRRRGEGGLSHLGGPAQAKAEGTEAEQTLAFADCFRMLYQRISIFVSLPFDCLSKLSLRTELDQIGKTQAAAAKEPISPALATPGHRAERSAPPRVDKDRRPSYVSRAAASLAFFGRFPPVLCEAGRNGSMTLRSGAFAPKAKATSELAPAMRG